MKKQIIKFIIEGDCSGGGRISKNGRNHSINQNQRVIKKPIVTSHQKTAMAFWFAPGIGIIQIHITVKMKVLRKKTHVTYDETLENYIIN